MPAAAQEYRSRLLRNLLKVHARRIERCADGDEVRVATAHVVRAEIHDVSFLDQRLPLRDPDEGTNGSLRVAGRARLPLENAARRSEEIIATNFYLTADFCTGLISVGV